jgi:hypothetical protein
VAHLSATQLLWRGRIERGLRVAAPFLDLVLVAGDRLSMLADPPEPRDLESGAPRGSARTAALPDGR